MNDNLWLISLNDMVMYVAIVFRNFYLGSVLRIYTCSYMQRCKGQYLRPLLIPQFRSNDACEAH